MSGGTGRLEARLDRMFDGRTVLVVGSAPTARLPDAYREDWGVICVNGSGRVAQSFGIENPDLTVFASGTMVNDQVTHREMREAVSGLRTRVLAVRSVSSNPLRNLVRSFKTRRRLRSLDYSYDTFAYMMPKHWEPIVETVLGHDATRARNISTGAFCCLLAYHAGASQVVVCGIDPGSSGHAYSASNQPRKHADKDRWLLEHLKETRGLLLTR